MLKNVVFDGFLQGRVEVGGFLRSISGIGGFRGVFRVGMFRGSFRIGGFWRGDFKIGGFLRSAGLMESGGNLRVVAMRRNDV